MNCLNHVQAEFEVTGIFPIISDSRLLSLLLLKLWNSLYTKLRRNDVLEIKLKFFPCQALKHVEVPLHPYPHPQGKKNEGMGQDMTKF